VYKCKKHSLPHSCKAHSYQTANIICCMAFLG